MNTIKQLLEDLKNYKYVNPDDYYLNGNDFVNDCNKYLQNNPENEKEITILKRIYFEGNIRKNSTNFFYLDKELPLNETTKTVALQELCSLYLKNKDKAIYKAKENYTKQSFKKVIDYFKNKFLNYEIYMDMLNDIHNNLNDSKELRKTYLDTKVIKKVLDQNEIANIYNSGLSLFDYAFFNSIDYAATNRYIQGTDNNYTRVIRERKNTMEDKVIELIIDLNEGKIDIFDLLTSCKLSPQFLIRFANANKIHCKELSGYITSNMHYSLINESKELSGKLVINSVEVSNELKLQAMNILRENDIPLSTPNYKKMVRKLIKEETK